MTHPNRAGRPEPLIYYIQSALAAHAQAMSATACRDGDPMLRGLAPGMIDQLRATNPLDLSQASLARLTSALRGIDKWRAHPFRRDMPEPEILWSGGGARLFDFAPERDAPPVLAVPSLINNAQVLDLCEERSLMRALRDLGLRPCLIDWGDPLSSGAPQTVERYVADVLVPAAKALGDTAGRAPSILGYCVGGTLCVALASQHPDLVHRLALIGAPWDFAHLNGVSSALRSYVRQTGPSQVRHHIRGIGATFGAVPSSHFQQLFAYLAPMQMVQKFAAFDEMEQTSPAANLFVAVEDWLASGVPVAAAAAETILIDWYVENQTAEGRWQIHGKPVNPGHIGCPTLVVVGSRDHIVPPGLSAPLAREIPAATLHQVDRGHVGMILGSGAHAEVATPIYNFIVD